MEWRQGETDAELTVRMRGDPAIQRFIAAAREYCAWVVVEPRDSLTDAHTLLRLLADVYAAAVALPLDPPLPDEPVDERGAPSDAGMVQRRIQSLPFSYYWVTLNPMDLDHDAKIGAGDLCDDVDSIWTEVMEGLVHWDAGDVIEAVWTWRFMFESHWGEHAADAIRALHEWFLEDSDRWNPPTA